VGTGDGQFSAPQGITAAPNGDLWVADSNNNRVQHFDANGTFVNKWGSFGPADGQFSNPHGIAVDAAGFVYVADTGNYRIQKFTSAGAFVAKWGGSGTTGGKFDLPDGVAVDPFGNVYVSDGNNDRIQKFDSNGAFISAWGTTGAGNGQLNSPFGITTDVAGNVYIADTSNHRIQKFDSNGAFLAQFGSVGNKDGQIVGPYGVAVDPSGNVFVTDTGNYRLQQFDPSGKFLTKFGSNGSGAGQVSGPFGIAVSPTGNVYVSEVNNNRVSQFLVKPDPVLGRAMTAEVQSGVVLVRLPGSKQFLPLPAIGSLPVGTIVDARKGTVRITATSGGKSYTADFFEGQFQIAQLTKKGATADMKLFGDSFKSCPRGLRTAGAAAKKSVRHLWGKGSGQFRTVGRFSAATVRGTTWLTDDQCTGTLTKVTAGSVSVRDLVKKQTVLVRAGKSYLAKGRP
jgi:streptogramin lyase